MVIRGLSRFVLGFLHVLLVFWGDVAGLSLSLFEFSYGSSGLYLAPYLFRTCFGADTHAFPFDPLAPLLDPIANCSLLLPKQV